VLISKTALMIIDTMAPLCDEHPAPVDRAERSTAARFRRHWPSNRVIARRAGVRRRRSLVSRAVRRHV